MQIFFFLTAYSLICEKSIFKKGMVIVMEYMLEGDFRDAASLSIEQLVLARSKQTILQSTALLFDVNRKIRFEFSGYEAIMPFEEAAYSPDNSTIKDIAVLSKIGQKVCFVIKSIDFSLPKPLFILSRKEAQRRCHEEFLEKKVIGDIIDCRVTHIERYGAFCDIGCGIAGLLHIDCLSVSRIATPHDRIYKGQTLKTIIKSQDEKGRFLLTLKELLGSWDENAAGFSAGETVVGIVRSIEEYGVFIELAPNLSGLAEPVDGLHPGQNVSVYIKNIIPEKMKVKLSVVGSLGDAEVSRDIKYFYHGDHIGQFNYSSSLSNKNITTTFE